MALSGGALRDPRLWAVALTLGAITMMWTTYNRYVPQFLGGTFGLPATVIVAVLTLDNLLGFFLEPLTGLLSDRSRSRWGKRLPWLLFGAPVAVAALALMPFPPAFVAAAGGAPAATARWLNPFAFLIVGMLVAMAIFRTPAVALMPDLVAPPSRAVANGLLQSLVGLGTLAAIFFGDWLLARYSVTAPFLLASGVMVVAGLLLWRLLAGYVPDEGPTTDDRVAGWRPRLALMGAIFGWWLGFIVLNGRFAPLAAARLGVDGDGVDLLLALFLLLFTAAAVPAGLLGDRWGTRPTLLASAALLLGCGLVLPWLPGGMGAAALVLIVAGTAWAGVTVTSLPLLLEMGSEARLGMSTGLYYLSFAMAGLITPWLLRGLVPRLDLASYWLAPLAWAAALALTTLARWTPREEPQ